MKLIQKMWKTTKSHALVAGPILEAEVLQRAQPGFSSIHTNPMHRPLFS